MGHNGTILNTNDGGKNWSRKRKIVNKNLYSIVFDPTGTHGWIVGQEGTVLFTSNKGRNWETISVATDEDFFAIDRCEYGKSVCIVGSDGILLKSKIDSPDPIFKETPFNDTLWCVSFTEKGNFGCVVGAGGIVLLSYNCGENWRSVETRNRTPFYTGIVLNDEKTIWIVGDEGRIVVSRDRGETWQRKLPHLRKEFTSYENWLNACDFNRMAKEGWIVGTQGIVFNTEDGGKKWRMFQLEEKWDFQNIWYYNERVLWITGANGTIIKGLVGEKS